jgi:circadian clock protein KaiB
VTFQHDTSEPEGEPTGSPDELNSSTNEQYVLKLFVAGTTPRSTRAIANIARLCEQHLKGRYDLQIIDLQQEPALAWEEQIVAVPTLIKQLPVPLRRLVGDLSETDHVLVGLDLVTKK